MTETITCQNGSQLPKWQVSAQVSKNRLVMCKQLMCPSEDKDGNKRFIRIKSWQINIRQVGKSTVYILRMRLNESMQPTFTIQHPVRKRYQTIKKGVREIPIEDKHSPQLTIPGEQENFHTIKSFSNRIAAFGGFEFANEVMRIFYIHTPLGELK